MVILRVTAFINMSTNEGNCLSNTASVDRLIEANFEVSSFVNSRLM